MTIEEAFMRIDQIAAEQDKPVPKTETEIRALGTEAIQLFNAIEDADQRSALRSLRGLQ